MPVDKFKVNAIDYNYRKNYAIERFYGVDYTNGLLRVADYHATDILNVIYRDRVDQKRRGWEQVAKATAITYYVEEEDGTYTQKTNSTNFNGFWRLLGKDEQIYYVAHIGNILFEVTNIGKDFSFLETRFKPLTKNVTVGITTYNVAKELLDIKSMAFVGDHRLYILGGNKYYVLTAELGYFDLREVEDDKDTYIPITTIGITYKDSPVSGSSLLDDVNLMTEWRKNKLVSGTWFDDGVTLRTTRFWDYELDTNVKCKNPTDINGIKIKINSLRRAD